MNDCQRISVVDSHTAGEPTRVVIAGGPDLGIGPLVDRQMRLATRFDGFRRTVVCEPRGCDALVGALLCEPNDARSAAAALFFNNVGNLRMCVHGTIGLVVTLGHLGKIQAGRHRIETPAGVVEAELIDEHRVRVANVASYRTKKSVTVEIAGGRSVTGDVAYGGNWFFIAGAHDEALTPDRIEALTALAWSFRKALQTAGVTGDGGAEIDHIVVQGPPLGAHSDGRSFVLCPGGAYDRSPCGTGTSAVIACLIEDGVLAPGRRWRQESILGTTFDGFAEVVDGKIIPHIEGSAYITAEATLLVDPTDPLEDDPR